LEKSLTDRIQRALVSSKGIWKILAILALCLLVGALGGAILAYLSLPYTAALIVALVGGALLLRDTQWGMSALVGVICLLPFAAVPLDLGFEPTFLDLVLLSLLFVLASRIANRRQGPLVATPLALPILFFLVIIVVAMIAGLSHSSLNTTLIRRFAELLLGVFTFFIVVNCVKSQKQLEMVVRVLILAGFAAALREAGLPLDRRLVWEGFSGNAEAAIAALLELPEPPTAIVAAASWAAFGVLYALARRQIMVPDEIEVAVFGEMPTFGSLLTHLSYEPVETLAARAVEMLVDRVKGYDGPARRYVQPVRLIKRE